jgi:signal transduction histidine kinase
MQSAPLPDNESQRIQALERYEVLDTPKESDYDEITALASEICEVPISLISLVDPKRQWFKSAHGVDATETPREIAFCAHAILGDGVFQVENTLEDERFSDNPLVTDAPDIRFYAGIPLTTDDGYKLGTLCVIDKNPKKLTELQIKTLQVLGRQVMHQLELRYQLIQERQQKQALKEALETKEKFFSVISHDLRAPFNGLVGLSEMLLEDGEDLGAEGRQETAKDLLDLSTQSLDFLDNLLLWARSESGQLTENKQRLDLNQVCLEIIGLQKRYAEEKGCPIVWSSSVSEDVELDINMLKSIFHNLLSNAIKFSPQGKTIDCTLGSVDDELVLSITDHGVGMSEEKVGQLFKVGEQNISTEGTAGEAGSGLGLILCQQFAKAMSSTLSVTSTCGEGTTFTLRVPNPS